MERAQISEIREKKLKLVISREQIRRGEKSRTTQAINPKYTAGDLQDGYLT
jgi:hypothetical protein